MNIDYAPAEFVNLSHFRNNFEDMFSPSFRTPLVSYDHDLNIAFTLVKCQKCEMFVYSGYALSYTKPVHRHATQTE